MSHIFKIHLAAQSAVVMLVLIVGGAGAPVLAEKPPTPIEFLIGLSRAQLANTGFTRHQSEVRGEPIVWWSKGDGPTLVLIHGVSDQAGTWVQVAPSLAESYRLLLIDLPGHGESGPHVGPLPMTVVLEGFEAWFESEVVAKGGEQSILIGNSMGAWIASLVALRHPDWIQRIVTVNGGPLRAKHEAQDLLPQDREQARALMATLRDPSSPPTPAAVLDDLVVRGPTSQTHRMFLATKDLEGYLLDGKLAAITVPVEVLWGESDQFLGQELARRLTAGLPRGRLTWIERCGHLPQVECPARFREKLEHVLRLPTPTIDRGKH